MILVGIIGKFKLICYMNEVIFELFGNLYFYIGLYFVFLNEKFSSVVVSDEGIVLFFVYFVI